MCVHFEMAMAGRFNVCQRGELKFLGGAELIFDLTAAIGGWYLTTGGCVKILPAAFFTKYWHRENATNYRSYQLSGLFSFLWLLSQDSFFLWSLCCLKFALVVIYALGVTILPQKTWQMWSLGRGGGGGSTPPGVVWPDWTKLIRLPRLLLLLIHQHQHQSKQKDTNTHGQGKPDPDTRRRRKRGL